MSIRVLVVDDSAVVRRLLGTLLDQEAGIEVVGHARNGEHAIARVAELEPDVVTMDVEMPVMSGVEAVSKIRQTHPHLPIIMFSYFTDRGTRATMDALMAGATGYVTKRADGEGIKGIVRDQLAPRIRDVVAPRSHGRSTVPAPARRPAPPSADTPQPTLVPPAASPATESPRPPRTRLRTAPQQSVEVLAIGCSTGGPNALSTVLPMLPGDLGVPVLIVQHMPPRFTALLAERLDGLCALRVKEAEDGEVVVPNTVYIAPGGFHMRVARNGVRVVVALDEEPPVNSCRPAVDPLFASVVKIWGPRTLGAILTGMGQDGLDGARLIVEAGGCVISQDEATSVVWGMPRAVAQAELSDQILPLNDIGPHLARRVRSGRPVTRSALGRTA